MSADHESPTTGVDTSRDLAQRALDASRFMTRAVWGSRVDGLVEYLDDGVAFASAYTREYSYGKQAVIRNIRDAMAGRMSIGPFEVRNERYNVKALGGGSFLATAQYSVYGAAWSSRPNRKIYGIVSSMVWVRASNQRGLALILCHNSEQTVLPQRLESVRRTDERQIALSAHDTAGTTYWVMPSEIVYVKAARQYTEVHCLSRTLRLRGSFGSICEQLGGHVVGIHRSYAVNPLFVSRIEGEMLYLETGDKLPVPARRVSEVRRKLSEE